MDLIDLKPEGRAYTGVGFSRVQAGCNLCGNPEARKVGAWAVLIVFAISLLVATIVIRMAAWWLRRNETPVGGLQIIPKTILSAWQR